MKLLLRILICIISMIIDNILLIIELPIQMVINTVGEIDNAFIYDYSFKDNNSKLFKALVSFHNYIIESHLIVNIKLQNYYHDKYYKN